MDKSNKYRPEIDGMRAIAVIAVIINHFNKDFLPNGYLGVDIFFVISGYVITSSFAYRKSENFTSFISDFYKRRIKRLIPALIFFVIITSLLTCLFAYDIERFIRTGISSLFGMSNIYLLLNSTDYFAKPTEFNPFTHTWSLGVEEQFYIFFPLIIWYSGFTKQTLKSYRNLSLALLIITVPSVIAFINLYQTNPSFTYFSLPTRVWEISLGSLLFISIKKNFNFLKYLKIIPAKIIIFCILLVFFLPISTAVFSTLAIVLLTILLLVGIEKDKKIYDLFNNKFLTYLGKISYSLYLWHWGILSISRWTIGISWWTIPFQVLTLLFISIISYKYIETPFRNRTFLDKSNIKFFIFAFFSIALTSYTSYFLILKNRRYIYLGPKISIPSGQPPGNFKMINSEKNNSQSFFVFGDSQSGHIWNYIKPILLEKELSIFINPRLSGLDIKREKNLTRGKNHYFFLKEAFKYYENNMKENDIIGLAVNSPNKISPLTINAFEEIIERSAKKQINVIIFNQIPIFPTSSAVLCIPTWYRPTFSINENCSSIQRSDLLSINKKSFDFYKKISDKNSNVFLFDQFNHLCPPNQIRCSNKLNDQYLYEDGSHLSEYGGQFLSQFFIRFLKKNNIIN